METEDRAGLTDTEMAGPQTHRHHPTASPAASRRTGGVSAGRCRSEWLRRDCQAREAKDERLLLHSGQAGRGGSQCFRCAGGAAHLERARQWHCDGWAAAEGGGRGGRSF